jgi:hypothetical protein
MSTGIHQLGPGDRFSPTPLARSLPARLLAAPRADYVVAHRTLPPRSSVCPTPWPGRILFGSLLFVLLLVPPSGPAHLAVVSIPFRSVQSLILVEGKADGDSLTFLLDTGSIGTIVSTRVYRSHYPLNRMHRALGGPGVTGDSISVRMDLQLGEHRWHGRRIAVMNLDELSNIIGIKHIDGLLGQDVLRDFRSVRIDYRTHMIEFQE